MYVAIRCTFNDFDLRRDLLLFDKLALPELDATVRVWSDSQNELLRGQAADLEWLAAQGVAFKPSLPARGSGPEADLYYEQRAKQEQFASSVVPFTASLPLQLQRHQDLIPVLAAYSATTGDTQFLERLDQLSREAYDALSRAITLALARDPSTVPMPISSIPTHIASASNLDRIDVLTIAWQAMPFPAGDTPLEKLLDFRNDPDVKTDYLALHHWASAVASAGSSAQEVYEQAEYLISQFHRHLKLFKLEQDAGTVETLVTTAANIAEDLLKLRLGDAARLLFSIRKRRIALLREEASAPGRELAYVVKTAGLRH